MVGNVPPWSKLCHPTTVQNCKYCGGWCELVFQWIDLSLVISYSNWSWEHIDNIRMPIGNIFYGAMPIKVHEWKMVKSNRQKKKSFDFRVKSSQKRTKKSTFCASANTLMYEFSNCLRWQVIIPAFSISPVDFLIGTSWHPWISHVRIVGWGDLYYFS